MLRVARTQQRNGATNITWVHDLAESANLVGSPFDLVVAAASIHWMDHSIVFPRLSSAVRADHVIAIVDGDGAFELPWEDAWDEFLAYWIYQLKGETYEPGRTDTAFATRMTRYREWIDVEGEINEVADKITQPIASFIACQHSRDTFAPSKLGARMDEFDAGLRTILEPHANDGALTYSVRTRLEWGSIRTSVKER